MRRVGLVLGAGGVVGQAYHSGVLAALEHDLGWDPRTADVIVGTSAGSITGTLLRSGVPASELAAWSVRAPLSAEGALLEQLFGSEHPSFDAFEAGLLLKRPLTVPNPHMVRRALARPWQFRPVTTAMALLTPGEVDIRDQLTALREVEGHEWPEEPLWIPAVRRRDGRRTVFGRPGTPDVPLHLAVASSCSVPGFFAPVRIAEHEYVDGGAHSPTNAAILRHLELDLVIIVSPMSGPSGGVVKDFFEAARWHAGRLVRREAAALRARGTEVVVFRPGVTEQEAMGNDFMSSDRVIDVVQQSFLGAGAHAAKRSVRESLLGLSS